MRLTIAQRSARGGRRRNEDTIGFRANETLGGFVLADGTGRYEGGAPTSETVVRQVPRHLPRRIPDRPARQAERRKKQSRP
ncbi:MAG: hypothetical protein LBP86_01630 [Azoarcus sp.]|jgi:serine/threonine protein phosphatase PrpC|nr:hypothetical protein [Azoarcus sp.]